MENENNSEIVLFETDDSAVILSVPIDQDFVCSN